MLNQFPKAEVHYNPRTVVPYSAIVRDEHGYGFGSGMTGTEAIVNARASYAIDRKVRARRAQLRAQQNEVQS